ncbi:MAG: transglycosylase SLT domain-containing protein, partial [Chloroflexota bacterium]|nr:transglycosylase SLT domain-containing protein [Chloroflexota bacterium]
PTGAPRAARATTAAINLAPLIGPWHVVSLLSFLVVAGVAFGVTALIALLVWRADSAPTNANSPVTQPAPPPVIALVINLPALATPAPLAVARPEGATLMLDNAPNAAPTLNPLAPLVMPDQVSAPAAGAAASQRRAPIAPVAQSSSSTTYQQLFQTIGLRYDLNWRMLAAQAYIESSFDAVALGSQGTLGLMQIMPATWREWAPTVAAADPFDSYSNVLVAAVYLDYLRSTLAERGYPQTEWMLVAYNWGIDKVLRHLENGLGWEELPQAPRMYALDILRIAETIPAN